MQRFSAIPESAASTILVIGSDAERLGLAVAPSEARIALIAVGDGATGLKAFYAEHPDLIVLDAGNPDVDGWAVLETIRELSDVPVLMLTAPDLAADRVRGLRAGADDCVPVQFGGAEIQARIEALLRRPRGNAPVTVLDDEFVHVDRARHRVEVLGAEVELTPTEFRMLATFAEHPGQVLGHRQLLELVWGDAIRELDEVKLYVSYLRRKLAAAARVNPVETVRGVGYRYRPQRLEAAR